jgi:hypothetical protein
MYPLSTKVRHAGSTIVHTIAQNERKKNFSGKRLLLLYLETGTNDQ